MKLYKWNVKNYLSKNKSIFVGIVKLQYLKNVWIYGIFLQDMPRWVCLSELTREKITDQNY